MSDDNVESGPRSGLTPSRTFSAGRMTCEIVPDGTARYRKETLFSGVAEEELERAVRGKLDDEGWLMVPYNPLLVRSGDQMVLLDAGAGVELAAEWEEPVGRLLGSLAAAGVHPDQVTVVVISHAHPDHVGGLTVDTVDGRRPIFSRARHVISAEECEFWFSQRVPEEFGSMADTARRHLFPVRDAGLLHMVEGEAEIAPGLRIVPAPGHTPGHVAVSIGEAGTEAMYLAEAVVTEINLEHPDWTSRLEIDRVAAAQRRRRLLDLAARNGSTVAGFHLGAVGRIEATNGRYRLSARA